MKMCKIIAVLVVITMCLSCTGCLSLTYSYTAKEEIEEKLEDVEPIVGASSTISTNVVSVPKFIGLNYAEDIEDNAAYSEFHFFLIGEDANDPSCEVGEVFKQSPAYGSEVKQGAIITLYVNNDTPDEAMLDAQTDVVGQHKDVVRKWLQDKGFRVQERLTSHDSVAKDCVVSIDIELGQPYPYGTLVTVMVSSGPAQMTPIDFPPILGFDKEVAMEILQNRGFTGQISIVERNYTGDTVVEKGVVMAVAIGGRELSELPEMIAPDATLTLIVSTGMRDNA